MSMQMQFSAIKLDRLKGWLSSKDPQMAEAAVEAFEQLADEVDLDESLIPKGVARIQKLLESGKGEPVETIAEVSTVNTLAANSSPNDDDDFDWGDSEVEYAYSDLCDLQEQMGKRFGEAGKKLLDYMIAGRPLVGESFHADAGMYAYLTNKECGDFYRELDKVFKETSEIIDSGAMNEQDFDGSLVDTLEMFMQTVDVVRTQKADLFTVAC